MTFMMKRVLAFLAAMAVLGLVGCGEEKPESSVAETSAAESSADASSVSETEAPTEAPTEEVTEEVTEDSNLIGAELPDISGELNNMQLKMIGVELAEYFQEPAIRFYMEVTNLSKYMNEPRDVEGYSFIVTQNGQELESVLTDDETMEEYYWISDFYSGTTTDACASFELLNDTDPVTVSIEWEDGIQEYVFDITNVCGAPDSFHGLDPVTDTDWFAPDADTITIFDVDYNVLDAEIIPGYSKTGEPDSDVLRVTYQAASHSDDDTYIGTPFTPVQDGMELLHTFPMEKIDSDLEGAVTIHPGETVTYTYVYDLHSKNPVFFVRLDVSGLTGTFLTLE